MLDRVIMALYTLVLVVLAALIVVVAAGWGTPLLYWQSIMAKQEERWVIGALAAVVALIGLRVLVRLLAAGPPSQAVIHSNPTGDVEITLEAMKQIVGRVARQVHGVREVRPRIKAVQEGVLVFVEASVHPDMPIPQVTKELQEKIQAHIQEMVGVRCFEVKVVVDSVLRERSRVR